MGDSMAPGQRYDYEPLAKPRFIRLLTLLPSPSSTKPLKCRLHQVLLDELKDPEPKNTYEALSYVWGAKNGTIPITCGGRKLLITPNCDSALRHLRHKLTRRVLWIDAICIDQQSVEERNCQVPLMGEIYTAAKKVIIWLGPCVAKDEDLLRLARWRPALPGQGLPADKIIPNQRARKWLSKVITEGEVEAVRRICCNVWFTRIWTIQELLLATSAVFQVGHAECPAGALYNFVLIAETFAQSAPPELRRFQMRNRALEILHPEASRLNSRSFMADYVVTGYCAENDPVELLTMLWQLSALSDASDSRDKVYGMCGLLQTIFTREASLPEVDYNSSTADILEDATRCLISSTKSLWPLEIIARPSGTSAGLPSWVPDLCDASAISTNWQPRLRRVVSSDAKMNFPVIKKNTEFEEWKRKRQGRRGVSPRRAEMVVPVQGGPGRLLLRGKYLAVVDEVYARMPTAGTTDIDGDRLRAACLSEWAAVAAGLDESRPDMPPDDCLEALERLTPALNFMRRDKDSLPSTTSLPRETWNELRVPGPSMPQDVYDGAVLFRTACGLLGLCKGDIRRHDSVWQLAGGRFPFILHLEPLVPRQLQDEVHRLVGIADIHGLESEDRQTSWAKEHVEDHFQDIELV